MASGRRVEPYGPLTSVTGLDNIQTYEVASGAGEYHQILTPDPMRLYAVLFFALSAAMVSPMPQQSIYGLDSSLTVPGRSLLLHNASYPGLVQRDWYGYWAAPGSVFVIDVSAKG